jgi:hypothetical protein
MALQIPANLESITPEWLTQVLISSNTINDSSITAVASERLGPVLRLRPTYDTSEESAPESIIAKISSPIEIGFHTKIANESNICIPYCYYGAFDKETETGVLLLEDLQNGHFGDMVNSVSRENAERIIEHIIPFHAAWWNKPDLQSMDWIRSQKLFDDPNQKEKRQQWMDNLWRRFTEKFGDLIPTPIEEVWPILVQHIDKIRRQFLVQPFTLCHGDYHLENLFFGFPKNNRSLVVCDWEALTRAPGPLDLSYFMIWNLEPELRRELEKDQWQKYCIALKEHGVNDYSVGQCEHSYGITLYDVMLPRLVNVGAVFLNPSNEQEKARVGAVLRRTSEAIMDYPIEDLI